MPSPVRVLDLSSSIGGGYCARLLSQVGFDVVLGEPTDGHPLRRWSSAGWGSVESGALFAYLHGDHEALTVGEEEIGPLAATADVLIVEGRPDPAPLMAADERLIVASITPYGLSGPYSGFAGTELTVQADGGALAIRGHPSRPPFQAGGQSTEWLTGSYAAAGVMALLRRRDAGSRGGLVDVSWAEVASLSCTLFADVADALAGRPDPDSRPARSLETPSVEPTRDGYVGFNTNTAQMFSDFLLLIGRADLIEADPAWALARTRLQRWDEWNEIVHAWTTRHTTDEIVEAAAVLRVPAAPVLDAPGVLACGHFVERGVFEDDPTGRLKFPRRPWRIVPGEAAPGGMATQRPGADRPMPADRAPADRAPAAGLTVVDLTTWWAGPAASGFLAALGADVVHVESAAHVDGMRMIGGMFADRPDWWELSSFFLAVNANKRGITLDLGHPEGRELLLRLIARADVVMENFTPRVVERFDLGWDAIHAANPRAVMVRMPAFGLTGPWRDRPGFAQTMEQVSGLAWVTGYTDDQPRIQRGPCDPNAGMHAAIATLAALRARDETGRGCFVEVPMVEAALAIAAEPVLEWTAYGRIAGRLGNRSPRACPQGVYACAGTEKWLALSVPDDATWSALVDAMGSPVWAKDADLERWESRRRREDELDAHLGAWVADQALESVVERLRRAGVPAAPAWDPRRVSSHPQFRARGFYEEVDHPVAGRIAIPTQPLRLTGVDRWTTRPAPTLGQHNDEVLGLLGLDRPEMDRLEAAGVIGSRPPGY